MAILQYFENGIQFLASCIFIVHVCSIILLARNHSTVRYIFFHKGGFPMGPLNYKVIQGGSYTHRRPFNACWRLLDLPELTPRKYIQQGTQLKFC